MAEYTLEREYKIYNDKSGAKLRIGPDLDGLGLLEIDGGNDYGRLIVPEEVAGFLAHAILMALDDLKHFQAGVEEKIRPECIPDRDGWIAHSGLNMPLDMYQAVEVELRDGTKHDDKIAAYWHSGDPRMSNWVHDGHGGDIVRYRAIES